MSQPQNPEILQDHFVITSSDIDFTRKLNVSSLVDLFVLSAWHHAEALGFGIEFLDGNGAVWMLSRLRIQISGRPLWNEPVILRTWPKGIQRVFYQRDFELLDKQNAVVASGTSEWLIIDIKARRPKLYNTDSHIFNNKNVKHAIESPVPVLEFLSAEKEEFTRKVVYSDIDLNKHLTTIRYIDWIFDTFSIDFLRGNSCSEIVINFMHEIPFSSEVFISRYHPAENIYEFEFTVSGQSAVCFRARVIF